jgi:hypothetical protein
VGGHFRAEPGLRGIRIALAIDLGRDSQEERRRKRDLKTIDFSIPSS